MPLVVVAIAVPVFVVASLLVAAMLMTPAIVRLVAARRFAQLEARRGGGFWSGVAASLGCTVVAAIALVLSIPFWFVPPLVLVLPPLIWGWLTYRVFAYDVAGDTRAPTSDRLLVGRARPLLGMGVAGGFMGAAPTLLWAVERAGARPGAVPHPGLDLAVHAGVRLFVAVVRALPLAALRAAAARRGNLRRRLRRRPATPRGALPPDPPRGLAA